MQGPRMGRRVPQVQAETGNGETQGGATMTNYARVTKAGAVRLMRPELEGQTVTYERLHDVCYVALNVTLDGQPVSTALSYKERTDDDLPSLQLLDVAVQ